MKPIHLLAFHLLACLQLKDPAKTQVNRRVGSLFWLIKALMTFNWEQSELTLCFPSGSASDHFCPFLSFSPFLIDYPMKNTPFPEHVQLIWRDVTLSPLHSVPSWSTSPSGNSRVMCCVPWSCISQNNLTDDLCLRENQLALYKQDGTHRGCLSGKTH